MALAGVLAVVMTTTGWASTVEEIETRPGQKLRILVDKPTGDPVASLILLSGSHGNLSVGADGKIGWAAGAGNALIRNRADYAAQGYYTVTPDIAPDHKKGATSVDGFRWSDPHASDIGALVKSLRALGKPVIVAGSSRGAISVFNAAARLTGDTAPDALIAASGMLVTVREGQPSVARQVKNLAAVKQPVLLIANENDQCVVTPAYSAERFKPMLTASKKVDIAMLKGGLQGKGDACEEQSYHGFLGLDRELVNTMTSWMKGL
jgi:pimeloyl-ACP methyl ester carboxylesterase